MRKIIIGALALLVIGSVPSVAQMYRGDAREYRQEQRIRNGVRTGRLTPGEARRLAQQQRRIDRAQARARYDGYVSPRERQRIERMQNRSSRNIYQKKHNYRGY
ncbi:hypothetical protein [Aureimonas leprariae]|uniref:Uncharacterized protein n=1 Tax=Plantimonas leprariae TaxID=2615207 RepID=A0A7V7PMG5_9HYPH|nr:hypothetical protein [Aureimonas leprariae]KAB0678088.1 hypothetical protein F6X38_16825 [Aureimonas leprariae]